MLFSVYYGEISDERKEKWDIEEDNPYKVLKDDNKISCYDWMQFLAVARKSLTDEIQIDWGSFAWKGDKFSIGNMVDQLSGGKIEGYSKMKPSVEYGVVFIEEC